MALKRNGTFSFTYGADEKVEGGLVVLEKIAGIDEGDIKDGYRTFELNGETYYTIVSQYTGQQRLSVGNAGCLKVRINEKEGGFQSECEAVVTSTSIRRTPTDGFDETDKDLFEDDGLLKLIQKFTVTA